MRILMTGATGAIGVPLTRDLLNHGAEISAIARIKPGQQRLFQELFHSRIKIIPGDVTEPFCGVTPILIKKLRGSFDAFLHVAGKVQYHEYLRQDTYRVNKVGTEHALDLANELGIEHVVFMGTCYVAGKRAYLDENEEGEIEEANNPYESSKMEGEKLIRRFANKPLILRLSTVIGNSETGHLVNVGGYAGFVRGLWAIRERLLKYPKNPFWLAINPESTLNLIPNDWVVEHIRKAVFAKLIGTFHLSHTHPVKLSWLFHETIGKWLKIPISYERLKVEETALYSDPVWREAQEFIMNRIIGYFGQYVSRDTTFGHREVQKIPGYKPPPPITEDVIAAQMSYMINSLFQKKKLEKAVA